MRKTALEDGIRKVMTITTERKAREFEFRLVGTERADLY